MGDKLRVSPSGVQGLVDKLYGDQMHAKRRVSLSMAVIGVVHAVSLNIHRIGRGLAAAMELDPKHSNPFMEGVLVTRDKTCWASRALGAHCMEDAASLRA